MPRGYIFYTVDTYGNYELTRTSEQRGIYSGANYESQHISVYILPGAVPVNLSRSENVQTFQIAWREKRIRPTDFGGYNQLFKPVSGLWFMVCGNKKSPCAWNEVQHCRQSDPNWILVR